MSDKIRKGQIWREWRKNGRFIVITHVHGDGMPTFITCNEYGDALPRARYSNAKPQRFGRPGGYTLTKLGAP